MTRRAATVVTDAPAAARYTRTAAPRTVLSRPEMADGANVARYVASCIPGLPGQMHEDIYILTVDAGLRPVGPAGGLTLVGTGGPTDCSLSVPRILRAVLLVGAPSFILIHNHPSGDPTLSPQDLRTAAGLSRAAEIVDLKMLDSVVVAADGAWSALP